MHAAVGYSYIAGDVSFACAAFLLLAWKLYIAVSSTGEVILHGCCWTNYSSFDRNAGEVIFARVIAKRAWKMY